MTDAASAAAAPRAQAGEGAPVPLGCSGPSPGRYASPNITVATLEKAWKDREEGTRLTYRSEKGEKRGTGKISLERWTSVGSLLRLINTVPNEVVV